MEVAADDALVADAVVGGGDVGGAAAFGFDDAGAVDRADGQVARDPQKPCDLIAVRVAQRDLERLALDAHGDVAVADGTIAGLGHAVVKIAPDDTRHRGVIVHGDGDGRGAAALRGQDAGRRDRGDGLVTRDVGDLRALRRAGEGRSLPASQRL